MNEEQDLSFPVSFEKITLPKIEDVLDLEVSRICKRVGVPKRLFSPPEELTLSQSVVQYDKEVQARMLEAINKSFVTITFPNEELLYMGSPRSGLAIVKGPPFAVKGYLTGFVPSETSDGDMEMSICVEPDSVKEIPNDQTPKKEQHTANQDDQEIH